MMDCKNLVVHYLFMHWSRLGRIWGCEELEIALGGNDNHVTKTVRKAKVSLARVLLKNKLAFFY